MWNKKEKKKMDEVFLMKNYVLCSIEADISSLAL